MAVDPVVIGDAASQGRAIQPDDFAVGWKVTGNPQDAVALDTWRQLIEVSLRSILTDVIVQDAPTGLVLSDARLTGTVLRIDYTVQGQAAHLQVDLAQLFPDATDEPANIGETADDGDASTMARSDHVHRLPSRAVMGETPIVGLDQMATAPEVNRGKRIGTNPTTGVPEYQDAAAVPSLSDADPEAVGGSGAPAAGDSADSARANHQHALELRSVGLGHMQAAPTAQDFGRVVGFDLTTGLPIAVDQAGRTFLSHSDTPAAFGAEGQAPVVNDARTALIFGGPFAPLPTPGAPANTHATDAFDMALQMQWDAVPEAEAYEWQRKVSAEDNWPTDDGTRVTATGARATALMNASHDFRVRAVGAGGLRRSAWSEVLNIPVIATPTPAQITAHVLSRVRSRTLRFTWTNVDVTNGGAGAGLVRKVATYQFERREAGAAVFPNLPTDTTHLTEDVAGLDNGELIEMRVRGVVRRSDGSNTSIEGPWSEASNQEKPVKDNVTVTFGVADSRTGAITSPRTIEVPTNGDGVTIDITSSTNPATAGQFYALDVARGPEYDHAYNVRKLETRPLPSDITRGADFQAENEPATGPRRYSVGPALAIAVTQLWYLEVE